LCLHRTRRYPLRQTGGFFFSDGNHSRTLMTLPKKGLSSYRLFTGIIGHDPSEEVWCHPEGAPGPGRSDRGPSFGADAAQAVALVAEPLAPAELYTHAIVRPGQVGQRAFVGLWMRCAGVGPSGQGAGAWVERPCSATWAVASSIAHASRRSRVASGNQRVKMVRSGGETPAGSASGG
jgi:hypothetical protein